MQTLAVDAGPRDCAVQAVVGPRLLPLRLIVVPLPPDKVEINRTKCAVFSPTPNGSDERDSFVRDNPYPDAHGFSPAMTQSKAEHDTN
jgi:hypothetical protein